MYVWFCMIIYFLNKSSCNLGQRTSNSKIVGCARERVRGSSHWIQEPLGYIPGDRNNLETFSGELFVYTNEERFLLPPQKESRAVVQWFLCKFSDS